MVVREPDPPAPNIVEFCAKGLGCLNLMLAARLNSPEFAAIPAATNEEISAAWLKFLSYYVSLAKVTGPMGALSAAVMATAYAYIPPAFLAAMRANAAPAPAPGSQSGGPAAPVDEFVMGAAA